MSSFEKIVKKLRERKATIASIDFLENEGFVLTTNIGTLDAYLYPEINNLTQKDMFKLKKMFDYKNTTVEKAQKTKKQTTKVINKFITNIIDLEKEQNNSYFNIFKLLEKVQNKDIRNLLKKELKRNEKITSMVETLKISYVDSLTGCFNTTFYHHYLSDKDQQWNRSEDIKKYNVFLNVLNENNADMVMFIDLNNFKTINDTLSHDAGDRVLQNLGQILQEKNLPSIRRGGDEFIIVGQKNKLMKLKQEFDTQEFLNKLNRGINTKKVGYLKTIQTTIAYGTEQISIPQEAKNIIDILITKQTLTTAINKAEEKMYKNKKEYKAKEDEFERKLMQHKGKSDEITPTYEQL